MNGWLLIDENTPRDGTHILIAIGSDHVGEGWWEDSDSDAHPWKFIDQGVPGSPYKAREALNGCRDARYGPTHWQPLPKGPYEPI